MPKPLNILFAELTADALTPGRWFDGLAAGTFRDMHGREVTFSPDELKTYVANTRAAIAATKGESGELAGLPIDARDHEKGDGAGWIVDVQQVDSKLRLLPNWTEVGRELIGKAIRRFFSATVDTVNKVILGGTLTNWPATRDSKGKVMLRPIELSSHLYQLADESLDEQTTAVRRAFYDAMQSPAMDEPYICEIFDGYVIVRAGESLFRVAYTRNDDGVMFAARAEWVEVKQSYVEAALDWMRGWLKKPAKSVSQGEGTVTIKLTELSADDRAELLKQLAAQLQPSATNGTSAAPPVDLSQLLGINGLTDEGKKQLQQYMQVQAQTVQQQAQLAFQAEMARIQRDNAVTELAQRLTNGTTEAPRGLKGVSAEAVKQHLLALPADEAKWFAELLQGVVKDGLIEFAEIGHGRKLTGVQALPAEIATKLDEGVFKIADLSNSILGLGDLAQYDLSKWQGKAAQ